MEGNNLPDSILFFKKILGMSAWLCVVSATSSWYGDYGSLIERWQKCPSLVQRLFAEFWVRREATFNENM